MGVGALLHRVCAGDQTQAVRLVRSGFPVAPSQTSLCLYLWLCTAVVLGIVCEDGWVAPVSREVYVCVLQVPRMPATLYCADGN